MNTNRGTKFLTYLLVLYILSLGFTDLLNDSLVGKKIQIPEIIFIPLFITWGWIMRKSLSKYLRPNALEVSIVLYLVSLCLSYMQGYFLARPLLEVIGVAYLILVFVIFKTSLSIIPQTNFIVRNAFLASGVIASILGILGWILSQSGIQTNLAMPADIRYPYFGYIARSTALMNSPNMLFNFLSICLLVVISQWNQDEKFQKHIKAGMILIAIGIILTFSKSILILFIAILFLIGRMPFFKIKISKTSMAVISTVLFLIWIIGTHILIRKHSNVDLTQGAEKAYTLATPFAHFARFDFFQTNYTVNKAAAIEIGSRFPILGVRPGQFGNCLKWLWVDGLYPSYFIAFDPHSSYFGAFAETGVVGLLALLLLWLLVAETIKSIPVKSNVVLGIAACLLFIAIEAISMDVMNFRHLWVVLGILAFLFAKQTHDIKTIGKDQQA